MAAGADQGYTGHRASARRPVVLRRLAALLVLVFTVTTFLHTPGGHTAHAQEGSTQLADVPDAHDTPCHHDGNLTGETCAAIDTCALCAPVADPGGVALILAEAAMTASSTPHREHPIPPLFRPPRHAQNV